MKKEVIKKGRKKNVTKNPYAHGIKRECDINLSSSIRYTKITPITESFREAGSHNTAFRHCEGTALRGHTREK